MFFRARSSSLEGLVVVESEERAHQQQIAKFVNFFCHHAAKLSMRKILETNEYFDSLIA